MTGDRSDHVETANHLDHLNTILGDRDDRGDPSEFMETSFIYLSVY